MSDTNYSRWYREGTCSVTQNSNIVTGKNTYWLNIGLHPGDLFTLNGSKFYEVDEVSSQTSITLKTPFIESSASNTTYSIVRNFTATLPAEIAAQTTDIVAKHERFVNESMNTVQGKSAYEIATDNGFVGTEAQWLTSLKGSNGTNGTNGKNAYEVAVDNGFSGTQDEWLESLKAAGEWSILDERTKYLNLSHNLGDWNYSGWRSSSHPQYAHAHNQIFRGKAHGAFTEEHSDAIRSGLFTDIYPGDTFTINGHSYYVVGLNYRHQFNAFPDDFPDKYIIKNANGVKMTHMNNIAVMSYPYNAGEGKGMSGQATTYSDPTTGGYYNCWARNNEEGGIYKLQQQFRTDWTTSHLLKHSELLSSEVTDGKVSAWVNDSNCYAEMPSLTQLIGFPVSAEYDFNIQAQKGNLNTLPIQQFPLFKLEPCWGYIAMLTRDILTANKWGCYFPISEFGIQANWWNMTKIPMTLFAFVN